MAAEDKAVDSLSEKLAQLPPLDKYPNCYPEINPVDIYRSHASSPRDRILYPMSAY